MNKFWYASKQVLVVLVIMVMCWFFCEGAYAETELSPHRHGKGKLGDATHYWGTVRANGSLLPTSIPVASFTTAATPLTGATAPTLVQNNGGIAIEWADNETAKVISPAIRMPAGIQNAENLRFRILSGGGSESATGTTRITPSEVDWQISVATDDQAGTFTKYDMAAVSMTIAQQTASFEEVILTVPASYSTTIAGKWLRFGMWNTTTGSQAYHAYGIEYYFKP